MPLFEYSSLIPAPRAVVWAFHERADAIQLLTSPETRMHVIERTGGLEPGARIVFEIRAIWPLRIRWIAEHGEYEHGRLFTDHQRSGPFRAWTHRHLFADEAGGTRLTDSIEFQLKGGPIVDALAGWVVRIQLRAMFRYRHAITLAYCTNPGSKSAGGPS